MSFNFAAVTSKYRAIRDKVFRATEVAFATCKIKVRAIQIEDAIEADSWDDRFGVRTWSWQASFQALSREPKRLDLAVLVDNRLCALCLGKPTGGKFALQLLFIEADPHENPLKRQVLSIVFFAAHAYAEILGSLEVHICEPANDRLIALYEKYGYQIVKNRESKITHMKKAT